MDKQSDGAGPCRGIADATRWRRDDIHLDLGLRVAHGSAPRPCCGQHCLRLLSHRFQCSDVWNRAIADTCDAELCKAVIGWHAIHDHDVDREWGALDDPT